MKVYLISCLIRGTLDDQVSEHLTDSTFPGVFRELSFEGKIFTHVTPGFFSRSGFSVSLNHDHGSGLVSRGLRTRKVPIRRYEKDL